MKYSAALSIAGAGTLWGLIGLFVNLLAAKGFAPLQITTLRVTAALLFTALIIWRTDIRQFFIRPKDWWMFFGNGVIGLVFFNWCYFNAIAGGSLAIAALLLYTAPVFVMLMSVVLFHEKLTKEKIVALIITFIGCGCITGAFAGNHRTGSGRHRQFSLFRGNFYMAKVPGHCVNSCSRANTEP